MKNLQTIDKDYQTWWTILHSRRAMRKVRAKELLRYRITPEEAAVLFVVHTAGPRVTPADISRWILREPHSTFGLLQRMEKKGLVRKVKDLERKNLIRVLLTEKGREAYVKSAERVSIHRVMSSLSEEEQEKLRTLLGIIWSRALEELDIEFKPPFLNADQR